MSLSTVAIIFRPALPAFFLIAAVALEDRDAIRAKCLLAIHAMPHALRDAKVAEALVAREILTTIKLPLLVVDEPRVTVDVLVAPVGVLALALGARSPQLFHEGIVLEDEILHRLAGRAAAELLGELELFQRIPLCVDDAVEEGEDGRFLDTRGGHDGGTVVLAHEAQVDLLQDDRTAEGIQAMAGEADAASELENPEFSLGVYARQNGGEVVIGQSLGETRLEVREIERGPRLVTLLA